MDEALHYEDNNAQKYMPHFLTGEIWYSFLLGWDLIFILSESAKALELRLFYISSSMSYLKDLPSYSHRDSRHAHFTQEQHKGANRVDGRHP